VGWTFFFLMVVLKLPIAGLFWIVWRAIKDVDDEPVPADGEDGGTKTPPRPLGPSSRPRPPRRGPHGEPPLPAPPRSRTPAVARRRTGDRG